VVDGVVYVGDNVGNLHALDAATGEERWVFNADKNWERYVNSSPAVVDGTVFFVSGVRRAGQTAWLLAVDAASGKERWHFAAKDGVDDLFGTPAVAAGIVYVSSAGGILYAVDAGSGHERWRFDGGAPAVLTNPAVVGGVVYVGSGGDLHALDATSGHEQWSRTISRGELDTSPIVADGIVYLADSGGYLYAVDAASGDVRWQLSGEGLLSTAAIVGGLVYVGSDTGSLVAVGDPVEVP
jgi:outer membrane protein assembly factor BamB